MRELLNFFWPDSVTGIDSPWRVCLMQSFSVSGLKVDLGLLNDGRIGDMLAYTSMSDVTRLIEAAQMGEASRV